MISFTGRQKINRRTGPLGLFGLLAIVALGAALLSPPAWAVSRVPRVVGLKLEAAKALLKKEGFTVEALPKQSWFPGEHLKVFRQSPMPGPLYKFNKTVTIWYFWDRDRKFGEPQAAPATAPPMAPSASRIPDAPRPMAPSPTPAAPKAQKAQKAVKSKTPLDATVLAPPLLGMDYRMAEKSLKRKGLNMVVTGRLSTPNRFLADTVASQSPQAGLEVDRGGTVRVSIYEYTPRLKTGIVPES